MFSSNDFVGGTDTILLVRLFSTGRSGVAAGAFLDDCWHVSNFSGPAGKRADTQLFGRVAPGLTRLQKQSRGELRNVARANFWAQKTAADQASAQAQQQATGPQTGADTSA